MTRLWLKVRWEHTKLRLAQYMKAYPVQVTVSVALAVLAVPILMLVGSNIQLRESTVKLDRAQRDLKTAVTSIQTSRQVSADQFCKAINNNGRANNQQTVYLQGLILTSVKQSKPFEKIYRQTPGAPTYTQRLEQSKGIARDLGRFSVPMLDCQSFIRRVEQEIRQLQASGSGNQQVLRAPPPPKQAEPVLPHPESHTQPQHP